ncbi:beta-propeller domain-containing protein [Asanoa sp. NPDC050611]|uniref:beta-propeller domain-containing protein n=1 Tax=Asanoa sp. NPDC050611 TaxID=3157098 RepID=UPI0033FFA385
MTKARGGALALVALMLVSGCTAGGGDPAPAPPASPASALPAPAFRLVAFDSCADVLAGLKKAAKESVTPWGFPDSGWDVRTAVFAGGPREQGLAARTDSVAKAPPASDYSGTNVHEAGADEPDLVKTDGRRIVTITGGVLRVIDPHSRQITASLHLERGQSQPVASSLLLSGDRAMVLLTEWLPAPAAPNARMSFAPWGDTVLRLVTVDLAGTAPAVVGSYTMDGSMVDARQVGATARIVVRSRPQIQFSYRAQGTDAQRLRDNQRTIDRSTIDDWLPKWSATNGASKQGGRLDCGAVRRPDSFSGSSLLTVLSFDIGGEYDAGEPTTIAADGDLVYSNGTSLYVANDQQWRGIRRDGAFGPDPETVIYRFDITGNGAPRYVAAGSVLGSVLNQYAMSEFDGHLRVAVTNNANVSSVYVLRAGDLARVGMVGGLGKGERIYSVRFAGPVGYVVTFRQTDPLYTLDLSKPSAPAVRGELKINGYSAYLHPLDGGRLIGVGQDADSSGRVRGTQVSVFDVSDLAHPRRVSQHRIANSFSEAEHDPHAFLYWPPTGLLVVPVTGGGPETMLALRVSGSSLTEVGGLKHPSTNGYNPTPRRSLIVSGTLWTVSEDGIQATDPNTMRSQAWLPF